MEDEEETVQEQEERPQVAQQRDRGVCSWKPWSFEEPQAEHLAAPVGFLSVHLEQAQVLKSGLEGLAGVKRTDSQPTRSMRSAPARDERQESHLEEEPVLDAAQLGHFQVEGGRWGGSGWSSSSKILRRLLG